MSERQEVRTIGRRQANRARGSCQYQSFRYELPDQPSAGRAQGSSYSDLPRQCGESAVRAHASPLAVLRWLKAQRRQSAKVRKGN
jgi:hypothetical protein